MLVRKIVKTAAELGAAVQFGGGLRSEEAVRAALEAGVQRAVLGTSAVENPDMLAGALERWGPERIAAGVDAREGVVYVRGWRTGSGFDPLSVARRLQDAGVRWVLYTDIARDGLNQGLNLSVAQSLTSGTALNVVASGGVRSLSEVEEARSAGLAGVIVGRALYTGQMDPQALFALETPAC
jgi:phosphoribosylformimino-5-aminoimidazole carboxamide ribotide isomerase